MASATGSGTTSSGPSHPGSPKTDMAVHGADQETLATAMATNDTKAAEYGYAHAVAPRAPPGLTQWRRNSRSGGRGEPWPKIKTPPIVSSTREQGTLPRPR